jgi:glutamate synthase (NADPH/NADH) small chain
MRLRTSSSHEEGGQRYWSILTKSFKGSRGVLKELLTVEVETIARPGGGFEFVEKEGTQKRWSADMVLLALGFNGPERDTLVAQLQIDLDPLGCIATDDNYMTNIKGVFAAGDARRGQSLIVWAISEGRETARHIDIYLTGASDLPSKGPGDLPRA